MNTPCTRAGRGSKAKDLQYEKRSSHQRASEAALHPPPEQRIILLSPSRPHLLYFMLNKVVMLMASYTSRQTLNRWCPISSLFSTSSILRHLETSSVVVEYPQYPLTTRTLSRIFHCDSPVELALGLDLVSEVADERDTRIFFVI